MAKKVTQKKVNNNISNETFGLLAPRFNKRRLKQFKEETTQKGKLLNEEKLRCSLYLRLEDIYTLELIGDGNRSKGLKMSLERIKTDLNVKFNKEERRLKWPKKKTT